MPMQGHLSWHGLFSLECSNFQILPPETAPHFLTPFFLGPAAPVLGRCTVVLMLWHFHKEMDVVGSIRQHGDIYIRKNGCCWARGKEKEVGEEQQPGVITPFHTDAP